MLWEITWTNPDGSSGTTILETQDGDYNVVAAASLLGVSAYRLTSIRRAYP